MTVLDEFNELNYTGESTDSNIKILLNLRENGYLGDDGFEVEDLIPEGCWCGLEEMFKEYINYKTEDLDEGDVWDLLDKEDFTDSQGIYMMLEEFGDLSFITSHDHLVRASRLFALQYVLREDIDEWRLELKEELDIRFNKLTTLWKTRRDRKH